MIDFTQHNTEDQSCDREACESLKARAESIGKNLSGDKRSKFRLGTELRDLFNSRDFRTVCAIYYPIGNVRNCSGTVYFRYLKETFDLDRSAVSRLVNVADEFGDDGMGGLPLVCIGGNAAPHSGTAESRQALVETRGNPRLQEEPDRNHRRG